MLSLGLKILKDRICKMRLQEKNQHNQKNNIQQIQYEEDEKKLNDDKIIKNKVDIFRNKENKNDKNYMSFKLDTGEKYYKFKFYKKCNYYNYDYLKTRITTNSDVISIGDIHGDLDLALNFLLVAGVIDIYKLDKLDNNKKYIQIPFTIQSNNLHKLVDYYIDNTIKPYNQIINSHHEFTNDDKVIYIEWIGKTTYVVQVGDQIDINKNKNIHDENSDLTIIYLFEQLDNLARLSSKRVISLIGNHELYNFQYEFGHVTEKGINDYNDYKDNKDNHYFNKLQYNTNLLIAKHNKDTKKFENRAKVFNKIRNKFTCTRQAAIIINKTLYCHAGITDLLFKFYEETKENDKRKYRKKYEEKLIIEDINDIIRNYINIIDAKYNNDWTNEYIIQEILYSNNYDKNYNKLMIYYYSIINSLNEKSILDNRFYKNPSKLNKIINIFNKLDINNLVVGHQPTNNNNIEIIDFYNDKKIFKIDIGASINFKNNYNKYNKSQLDVLKISSKNIESISENKKFNKYRSNEKENIFNYLNNK